MNILTQANENKEKNGGNGARPSCRLVVAEKQEGTKHMTTKEQVLKQVFGYSAFRPGQEQLVDSLLSGRDTLGVMPTGAGKSICFQVPALMLPGVTLVVSPLISLMKDQVNALVQAGVRGAFLNSSLTPAQYRKALYNACNGMYKIIYVAPERLLTPGFQELVRRVEISMVCVDEAHCVSQWGQDFRPGYLRIRQFLDGLPHRPPVGAFTATATAQVRRDILNLLGLEHPKIVVTGFDRKNLYFGVRKPKDKFRELLLLLEEEKGKSGIIYCSTRKLVEEVCEKLRDRGIPAARYHAGLTDEERHRSQEDFLYDRSPVMVATNAFGMGIDKSNVSFVIHYNMPKDLESYYQEAGRAGRDGSPARCVLLYSGADVRLNQFMIEKDKENEELDEETARQVREKELERLKQMTFYATSRSCLRRFQLRYFGEEGVPKECGNCSVCLGEAKEYAKSEPTAALPVKRHTFHPEVPVDEALFQRLKRLRMELARSAGIPPYAVFTDATLREMCLQKPRTPQEMLAVPGVGERKLERYGAVFLRELWA